MDKIKLKKEFSNLNKNQDNLSFCYNLVFKNNEQNFTKTKEQIDFFISFCNANDMQKSKAWTYSFLGDFFRTEGCINKSIEYYNKSLSIFENIDYSKGIISISNILATIFYEMGVYSNSSRICKKAYKYVKLIKDREVIINLFYILSKDNIKLGELLDARDIIEYASINYELLNLVDDRILTYCIRSEIEYYSCNLDKSLELVKDANSLMERFNLFSYKSYIYKLLANINYKIGNTLDVDRYYNISIEHAKSNNLTYEVVEIMFSWGNYKLNTNCIEIGINILQEALSESINNNYFSLTNDICKVLYKIYKEKKDFKIALYYFEIYHYSYQKIQDYINLNYINVSSDKNLLIGTIYNSYKNKTKTLSNLGQSIISKLNIKEMLKITYESINKLAKVDYNTIALYDDKKNKLVIRSYNEGTYKKITRSLSSNKKELIFNELKEKELINLNNSNYHNYYNIYKFMYLFEIKTKINSSLFYPLLIDSNVIGIMSFHKFSEGDYSIEDEIILKVIVNYISIAVLNSMKYNIMKNNAIYDSLTRTLSRFEILKIGKNLASNSHNNSFFSIILTDINKFKNINDEYGHIVGDQILIMVTNIIKKLIRNNDLVGRYEGNKFLIICPKLSKEEAGKIANQIKNVVENTEFLVGSSLYINISLRYGYYEYRKESTLFEEGIDNASKMLQKF